MKNIKYYIPLRYRIKGAIAMLFFPEKKWEFYRQRYTRIKKNRNPKIIMTLLVRDEDDVLEQNLIYHKSLGIYGFIITDNGSNDNTRNIISKYQRKGF